MSYGKHANIVGVTRVKAPMAVLSLLLFVAGCLSCRNGDFDRIEASNRLPGIAALRVHDDGTVTLRHDRGPLHIMLDNDLKPARQARLKPGASCRVTDGRHASWVYEFRSVNGENVKLRVTQRFDARSFGDGIKQARRSLQISPYADSGEAPQQRGRGDAEYRAPHP